MIVEMTKLDLHPIREWPNAMESVPALRKSLVGQGQLVPLLVNRKYEIIDGLRRYIEARALGWEEVEIEIPDRYDEAVDLLEKTRLTAPETAQTLSLLRIWELFCGLEPWVQERVRERHAIMNSRPRGEKFAHLLNHKGPVRELLAKALGLPSETYIQALTRVFRTAEREGPQQKLAIQLRSEMVAGTRTAYAAYGMLRRDLERTRKVTSIKGADQRNTFKGMMPVIDALFTSLESIGDIAPDITEEEAKAWAARIKKLRGKLYSTHTKLNHHKTDKEK